MEFVNKFPPIWRYTFFALAALTALDILLWPFKTQTALFFSIFFLIPAWAIWVITNPSLEDKKETTKVETANATPREKTENTGGEKTSQ